MGSNGFEFLAIGLRQFPLRAAWAEALELRIGCALIERKLWAARGFWGAGAGFDRVGMAVALQ